MMLRKEGFFFRVIELLVEVIVIHGYHPLKRSQEVSTVDLNFGYLL
jgi:hypothetical protein